MFCNKVACINACTCKCINVECLMIDVRKLQFQTQMRLKMLCENGACCFKKFVQHFISCWNTHRTLSTIFNLVNLWKCGARRISLSMFCFLIFLLCQNEVSLGYFRKMAEKGWQDNSTNGITQSARNETQRRKVQNASLVPLIQS